MNPQARLEEALTSPAYDMSAKYLAISDLLSHPDITANTIGPELIPSLEGIFRNPLISNQVQAYFLYRQTAGVLASFVSRSRDERLSGLSLKTLAELLATSTGRAHRAAAEALGSLPFMIRGPKLSIHVGSEMPRATWEGICRREGVPDPNRAFFLGRSLVVPLNRERDLLVVKPGRGEDSLGPLAAEAAWMNYLRTEPLSWGCRFDIPEPLCFSGRHVLKVRGLPSFPPETETYAICFRAPGEYFLFPKNLWNNELLSGEEFAEAMGRNAYLLGRLASEGIVHSAPIPLFHNRIQSHRRGDNGIYEWPRGGRLDQWLYSCFYPNLGLTGIRDFEHFFSFQGESRGLYYYLGVHFLGLLLLAGSYSRIKNLDLIGTDKQGEPVDARSLFDKPLLEAVVDKVFLSYYEGFAGTDFKGRLPFDTESLVVRMVEEMGVDRHMEEVLRRVDQDRMAEKEFRDFLGQRGLAEGDIAALTKGSEDISLQTGPHLGGFNERISLPEMIEAVASMSALCIAGRFWEAKGLPSKEEWEGVI